MPRGPRATPLRLALALILLAPWAVAEPATQPPTIVAILDSGLAPAHPELDPGQLVAWRDFVNGRPDPYDDHGHGTATAVLVAGHNRGACGSVPKLAFAPGAPIVVGKVLSSSGSLATVQRLADALRWAIEQGATVVSISIGTTANAVLILDSPTFREAVDGARQVGVVVLVSAGNGSGAGGLPTFSWNRNFGNVPGVLAIGAANLSGGPRTGFDLQPDVTSWGSLVCTATLPAGYALATGTSFATPLVAGMVASARDAALAAGAPVDAERLVALVKLSARNSPAPLSNYPQEGLGFLLVAEAAAMRASAAAGTLPDYGAQGPHAVAELAFHEATMPLLKGL